VEFVAISGILDVEAVTLLEVVCEVDGFVGVVPVDELVEFDPEGSKDSTNAFG
jgi:hypothetical protein